MSYFVTMDLHDQEVIDLINERLELEMDFQACPPLTGENAPKRHHWLPDTDKKNIPLQDFSFNLIEEVTADIAKSYQDLVRRLRLKPNYIKGYLWAVLNAQRWGRLVAKNKLISSFELWEFIFKLSLYLIFSKYEIIHGNITGLHTYLVRGGKPILMTANRFVTRPRGSELIRAWCWYIARQHEYENNFISLLKTENNKLIVKLWLLGAMFDCINDTEYYSGNIGEISEIWSSI
jgi:hypothetical protein